MEWLADKFLEYAPTFFILGIVLLSISVICLIVAFVLMYKQNRFIKEVIKRNTTPSINKKGRGEWA